MSGKSLKEYFVVWNKVDNFAILFQQENMDNKKTFTYDEAFDASLRYFGGDELAARVWAVSYTHLTLPTKRT